MPPTNHSSNLAPSIEISDAMRVDLNGQSGERLVIVCEHHLQAGFLISLPRCIAAQGGYVAVRIYTLFIACSRVIQSNFRLSGRSHASPKLSYA